MRKWLPSLPGSTCQHSLCLCITTSTYFSALATYTLYLSAQSSSLALPALEKCSLWFRKFRKARSGYEVITAQSVTESQACNEEVSPEKAKLLAMPKEIRDKILYYCIWGNIVGMADLNYRYTNGLFISTDQPSTVQISDLTMFQIHNPTMVNQDVTLVNSPPTYVHPEQVFMRYYTEPHQWSALLLPLDGTSEWTLMRACRQLYRELIVVIFDEVIYAFSSARVPFRSMAGADIGSKLTSSPRPATGGFYFSSLKHLQVRVQSPL